MCLSTISVDWQGNLYDCDFNQMLDMSLPAKALLSDEGLITSDKKRHIRDLLSEDVLGQSIAIGDHCYGCTAGQGSSCGGALDEATN